MGEKTKPEPPKAVPISLRDKKRLLKIKGGGHVTVRKIPRGVEIEGLDIEGIATAQDKPT